MRPRFVSAQTISADAIALVGALAAITLTVLALVGIAPRTLTSIAAICTGAALLGHGALTTRRIFALRAPVGATFEQAKLGETASDEVLGGACAIALGVLALIGIEPTLLLGIAAIAIGGALVMSGPTREKLPHLSSLRDKYATLKPTHSGPKHRARRRTSKRRRSTGNRAKTRTVSRMRLRKDKVSAPMVAKRPRDKSKTARSVASASGPKSLTELIAELPPPPSQTPAPEASPTDDGPLFEPELLAPAHVNPDFADPRAIAGDVNVTGSGETTPTVASNVDVPERAADIDTTEVAARHADLVDQRAPRRGGLLNVVKAAASAIGKAKELKHKLDDALAAHPIEHRAPLGGHRTPEPASDAGDHALVKYNELAHGSNALEPVRHEHVDKTIQKDLDHEREAHAQAQKLVEKVGLAAEPAANKKLEAEKVREGDPTIDRYDGPAALEAAYQSEVVAKAKELEHELEHHFESEALQAQPDPRKRDNDERRRATIAEVEPVPTTSHELRRESALFAGGAAWVVGGLAAIVLGILALAGVARPFVLIEIAFLVAAASILVSSLLNGARVASRHHAVEEEHASDDKNAVVEAAALHARAGQAGTVELHR